VSLTLPAELPVLIVGAGPAGLMAAEQIAAAGVPVHVIDAMPSPGRKFLRAGIGGLNLTHAEPASDFLQRYSPCAAVTPWLQCLDAEGVRAWAAGLGVATFVGSSGRVFPVGLKAAPLLRAWLQRLRAGGVTLHMRHRWLGFVTSGLVPQDCRAHHIETPTGEHQVCARAVVFALGGGSWARLGSDGRWREPLQAAGVECAPLQPANCGFDYAWSETLLQRHAGAPLKGVMLRVFQNEQEVFSRKGEALISRHGLQGSLIYAASSLLREAIAREGTVTLCWDLFPKRAEADLRLTLQAPRGKQSQSSFLRKRLGLDGVRLALVHELAGPTLRDPAQLARALKCLPQTLRATRPLDEAISTAGGVSLAQLDGALMLRHRPGVFFAGEMLDWEAPTGGYLLTACLATGKRAGQGVLGWLQRAATPAA
jgi:uncharacterized flavoprotein (TIGR03862 family)